MNIEEIKTNFAKNIIRLRKQHHLNQTQLGEAIHYSSKAISKWENGETIPDIDVMSVIAEYFDVTVDELIAEDKPVSKSFTIRNRFYITLSSALLPFLVALIIFSFLYVKEIPMSYMAFPFGGIASAITLIVLTRLWYSRRAVFASITYLVVATTLTIILFLLAYWWLVLAVGVTTELILFVFFKIHFPSQDKNLRIKK